MIIKNIGQIIKSHDALSIAVDEDNVMWCGDGNAMYPLRGLPYMDTEQLFKFFDINEKKGEKITLIPPYEVSYADVCDSEKSTEQYKISLDGFNIFSTSHGAAFVNKSYLRPLLDMRGNTLTVWQRVTAQGRLYLAVKAGFELEAIIFPNEFMNTPLMLDELSKLSRDVEDAMAFKRLREAEERDREEQMEIEGDGE